MKWTAATLLLAACASVVPEGVPISGQWGGPHIGLTLDPSGGRIEYDCAAGTVGPVMPGPGGSFTAQGTHTPGFGGPEIQGQVRPSYPARFSGTVRGDTMTLRAASNGVELGPFTLRRGAKPGLLRCL